MAEIISIAGAARQRRQMRERDAMRRCVEIVDYSLARALDDFEHGPEVERLVRRRQIRHLVEVRDYLLRYL